MGQPVFPEDELGLETVSTLPVRVYDRDGNSTERDEWVIRERPVTLYLNGKELVTLLCAGHHLDDLAVGFFHAEGFVHRPEDILGVDVDEDEGRVYVRTDVNTHVVETLWAKRTITSGCGKGSVFYNALDALLAKPVHTSSVLEASSLLARVEDLNRLSETYRRTHGVHNTALADRERILIFRDDIGRHNAVDMIVGHVFRRGVPLDDKMLVTTGRLTSEILIKAARLGIPFLVSRNTATSLAVELARSLSITLIGYARAGKFTVYNGWERIVASDA